MHQQPENPLQSFVAYFAVLATSVFIISYGAVTSYYSGYLGYFGINIRYIDFWPHLPDFLILAMPIILALIVTGGMTALTLFILNIIGRRLSKKSQKSFLRGVGDSFRLEAGYRILAVILALSFATFSIIYISQESNGKRKAESETQFIRVGPDGKKIDVLIYQNSGVGFTKTYNKESKQFENGYKSINFSGQNLEQIELPKN